MISILLVAFEVVNVDGTMEARRDQACDLYLHQTVCSLLDLVGSFDSCMGIVHPQVSRSNPGKGQS